MLLTVFDTTDTATDRSFAFVVFAQILWVRKHSFQELQRNNFHTVVVDRLYACHTYILDNLQVGKISLTECHPEACTLDGRIVLNQRLQLFVIQQV